MKYGTAISLSPVDLGGWAGKGNPDIEDVTTYHLVLSTEDEAAASIITYTDDQGATKILKNRYGSRGVVR